MTFAEKLSFIMENNFEEWLNTREIVEEELSSKQSFKCICGRLATGLHEMTCQRFKEKVDKETLKRLKHLTNAYPNSL